MFLDIVYSSCVDLYAIFIDHIYKTQTIIINYYSSLSYTKQI